MPQLIIQQFHNYPFKEFSILKRDNEKLIKRLIALISHFLIE